MLHCVYTRTEKEHNGENRNGWIYQYVHDLWWQPSCRDRPEKAGLAGHHLPRRSYRAGRILYGCRDSWGAGGNWTAYPFSPALRYQRLVWKSVQVVVLLYKTTCFDGELHSSSEGRVWWEDIANLPNLKLSLDMRDMLRVFKEENLSEFFYYQESSAWKYVLK